MRAAFAHIPFEDPEHAKRNLAALLEFERPGLGQALARAFEESANPSRALVGLRRYIEGCKHPDLVADRMARDPAYLRLLVTLFSQSHFLTDIVCRYPEYIPWLCDEASLIRPRSRREMLDELLAQEAGFDSFQAACSGLRAFHQREILRIATRDIIQYAALSSVTEDLSNLADATLEAGLVAARRELGDRFGIPSSTDPHGRQQQAKFCILAMGKLGGQELNFSSDIDLLFLYSDEGQTVPPQQAERPGRSISNAEYFCKLGELIIQALGEQTAEGLIFRVDMRLRPHGRAGPLATGFESALEYYVEYGRAWERQALIKARPCAGDLPLGSAFLKRLRPFVFPKYFDDATLEDIRNTKQQTEALIAERGQTEREVKLGRGGIRDIEFTVQMLQLLNGGRWTDLRTTATLHAIEALGRHDCLQPFEATSLASNYTFLRQIEHRLQIEGGQQRHTLPADAKALDEFARRLGYADGAAFMRVYRDRAQETRQILNRFLAAKGAGHLWVGDLLNPRSDGHSGLKKLKAMGFKDPERARQELLVMATGAEGHPFTRHAHEEFSKITPCLLNALSCTARPGAVLLRLGQIFAGMKAPASLYALLNHNPVLAQFLVTLVANSEYLCAILIRDPSLLELLSNVAGLDAVSTRESLEAELEPLLCAFDREAALYRLRDAEMLRIGMRELGRGITVAQVGDELTLLAEVILSQALGQAQAKAEQRFGPSDVPFAILGLGKLGGWEMGYGSDLDLVFVYEAGHTVTGSVAPIEYFAAVASHTLKGLKEPTRNGVLYDIDARLRPDGKKGVLAIHHERLQQYYLEEAQPWERLALMKARAVAGDPAFAARVEQLAKDVAFSVRLDRAALEHVESLRRQAAAQADPLDLKKAEGGVNEIEYATRFWQLQHVAHHPVLKRGDVLGALDILREHALVDTRACKTLRQAYVRLRRILNRIRMMDGGHTSSLPKNPEERADLAVRLGIEQDLLEYVDEHRARVHPIYQTIHEEALETTS